MSTITFELVSPCHEDRRIETEDGMIFYRSATALYTLKEFEDSTTPSDAGRESRLEVSLSAYMELRGSVGNSVFFYTKEESKSSGLAGFIGMKKEIYAFYKTVLADSELTMTRVNEIPVSDEIEVFPDQPFYAVKKGTDLTVNRFDRIEKPLTFNIIGSQGAVTDYRLMHRNKLILTQTSNEASLCHVSNSIMLLRMPLRVMGIHLRDDSDLITLLLHSQKQVIVVNTKTLRVEKLEFTYEPAQPNSPAWDFAPADIVSVRDGVLTYTLGPQKDINKTVPRQLWRAKLPDHLR